MSSSLSPSSDVNFFFYYKLKNRDLINKISNDYTMKDAKYKDSSNKNCLEGKLVTFKNDNLGNIVYKINKISEYISLGRNIRYNVTNEFIEVDNNLIKANIIIPL